MRVIAGAAGGIILAAPRGTGTRPTTDKVKEAIFGMLGAATAAGRVLDVFAGSGGLGIEALSRGADWCDFVDRGPDAVAAIIANLEKTRFREVARVVRNDACRFLDTVQEPYDLILCDPPYGWAAIEDLLSRLAQPQVARDGAIVVIETGRRDPPLVVPPRLVIDRVRTHGDTVVTILRATDRGVDPSLSHGGGKAAG
jgi:16S rRNA (guanine(966)-N(2))-methyltransferase RsmD